MQGWYLNVVAGALLSSVICGGAATPPVHQGVSACMACEDEAAALAAAEATYNAAYDAYEQAYDDFLANPGPVTAAALASAEATLDAAEAALDAAQAALDACNGGPGGDPNEPPAAVILAGTVSILER